MPNSERRGIFAGRIPAAKRADSWYTQRVIRNYTLRDNDDMIDEITSDCESEGLLTYLIDSGALNDYDYSRLTSNSSFFLMHLLGFNELFDPIKSPFDWMKDIYKGPREEYVVPLEEVRDRFFYFFDDIALVTKLEGKIPIDPIMNEIFIHSFEGVEGYIDLVKSNLEGHSVIVYYSSVRKIVSEQDFEKLQGLTKILKKYEEKFARKVFFDMK